MDQQQLESDDDDSQQQELSALYEDNGGPGILSTSLTNDEESLVMMLVEDAALECSSLTFGLHIPSPPPVTRHHIPTGYRSITTSPGSRIPEPTKGAEGEHSQQSSRISMKARFAQHFLGFRRRNSTSCSSENNNEATPELAGYRLSAFDVLVVMPFYAACGIMAVLALGGAIFRSPSGDIPVDAAAHTSGRKLHLRWYPQVLKYKAPPQGDFMRTVYTLDEFVVAGVNLAQYGLETETQQQQQTIVLSNIPEPPFDLYKDWDLASQLHGQERWRDLISLFNKVLRDSTVGSKYHDESAVKQWLQSLGVPMARVNPMVPETKPLSMGASHKLKKQKQANQKTTTTIPRPPVASTKKRQKPVVDKHTTDTQQFVVKEEEDVWIVRTKVVEPQEIMEERSLVADGFLEFQCLLLWGRVYAVQWKQESHHKGIVHRNGTSLASQHEKTLPLWVDWDQVVATAERVGAHKSLFRVDILALPQAKKSNYAVSRVDFVPSRSFLGGKHEHTTALWQEATRLLMAGYKMGHYRTIPNAEFSWP